MKFSILSAVLVTLALMPSPGLAQSECLFWRARISGGQPQLPEPRTYLLFTPVTALKITVAVQNDGNEPIRLTMTTFVNAIGVELLSSNKTVSTNATWEPTLRLLPDNEIVPVVAGEHLMQPQTAVEWTGLLGVTGGVLTEGEYRVIIDIQEAIALGIAKPNGDRWLGRASPRTTLTVRVRSARSPAEIAAAQRALGQQALREKRPLDALSSLLKAASIAPADAAIASEVGRAQLQLRNFKEAIVWFERSLSLAEPGGRTPLPELLALAYLGADDEGNATRVLRQLGRSEARILADIARLRRAMPR